MEGDGSEDSDDEGGGGGEPQAPRPRRQRRVNPVGPLPAAFQRDAMTLTQRREDTHARVQHLYRGAAMPPSL